MDDDEDVNIVVFNDRYLLRRLRRVGILRGWLIIYISVFRIPSRIVRLLLNRAASMRFFFFFFFFCHEGLGIVAASVYLSLLNLIVLKFHHSEGGVSASSDASEIQIVSSVHGFRQRLPIHGSLLWSLRGSAGLHAGHDSGFGVYPRSWIRLRPYRHG